MKKLFLSSILFLSVLFSYAQSEIKIDTSGYKGKFIWEKIDSTKKTKEQLYTDTKLFIADEWKSAKDVIQNDDKEGGNILVKGLSNQITFNSLGATYSYTYIYNVTFKFKDSKYKFVIDNVKCYSTIGSSFDNKLFIEPHDLADCPYMGKKFEEKCDLVMNSLKSELQDILEDYQKVIQSAIVTKDW